MTPRAKDMKRLLQQVARDMGDGNTEARLAEQKEMLVSLLQEEDFTRRWRWRLAPFAIAAAAVVAVGMTAVLLLRPSENALDFWIGEERVAGSVGAWLEAPTGGRTLVDFEQGSRIVLDASSAARVVEATHDAVTIDLNRGALDADIVGNRHTLWNIDAGPFRVQVVGTRFTTLWNAETQRLDVMVHQGIVLVRGSGLSEHGVKVTRGKHLRADGHSGYVSLKAAGAEAAARHLPGPLQDLSPPGSTVARAQELPADETSPQATLPISSGDAAFDEAELYKAGQTALSNRAPSTRASAGDGAASAPSRDTSSLMTLDIMKPRDAPQDIFKRIDPITPSDTVAPDSGGGDRAVPGDTAKPDPRREWLLFYEKEELGRAIRAAEDIGIDALAKTLGPEELWKLQDAARGARKTAVALTVLKAFRERFTGSQKAKIASFLLGKIASDDMGETALAARWFNTYLEEDPNGPLAEEALGRLIIANGKLGKTTEAKSAARQYLRKYENGSFEGVARTVADAR